MVIVQDDGKRELFHYDREEKEDSISNITLSDDEARNIAAILGGFIYQPKELESIEHSIGNDFRIKWANVEAESRAINQTIGEIDIRSRYSIMVIAIIKKDQSKLLNPGPDTLLEEGDTLVISGEKQLVKRAIEELLSKVGSWWII